MQLHMLLKDIMRDIRDTNILENHATVLRNSLWVLRGYKYFVFLLEIYKALGTYQSNGKYKYYNARELIKEVIQITMTAWRISKLN